LPKNLELKASLSSVASGRKIARFIGATNGGILHQTDTYFDVQEGRLKLREIDSKRVELIYYKRANRRGSRFSHYMVIPVPNSTEFKKSLLDAYSKRAVVKKVRRLFLYENSRIHIDSVDGLGNFVEFEVPVARGKVQAVALMNFLKKAFRISSRSIVASSYGDLLETKLPMHKRKKT